MVYYDELYDDLKYASGRAPWQLSTVIGSGTNTWPSLALRRGIPAVSYNRAIPLPPSAAFGPWTGQIWDSVPVDVVYSYEHSGGVSTVVAVREGGAWTRDDAVMEINNRLTETNNLQDYVGMRCYLF